MISINGDTPTGVFSWVPWTIRYTRRSGVWVGLVAPPGGRNASRRTGDRVKGHSRGIPSCGLAFLQVPGVDRLTDELTARGGHCLAVSCPRRSVVKLPVEFRRGGELGGAGVDGFGGRMLTRSEITEGQTIPVVGRGVASVFVRV